MYIHEFEILNEKIIVIYGFSLIQLRAKERTSENYIHVSSPGPPNAGSNPGLYFTKCVYAL